MKCIICGKEIEKSKFSNKPICSSECFYKGVWDERVKEKDKPNIAIIGGILYSIANENMSGNRGHSGRLFMIEFFDGRKVITTNLWCGGSIPDNYKQLMPDNAKFVR